MRCVMCTHEMTEGLCPIVNGKPNLEQSCCSNCMKKMAIGIPTDKVVAFALKECGF